MSASPNMIDFSRMGDSFARGMEKLRRDRWYEKGSKPAIRLAERRAEPIRVLPIKRPPTGHITDVDKLIETFASTGMRYGAHPDVLEFVELALRELDKYSIPMFPFEIIRTIERQVDLYNEGFSKTLQGAHTVGCAVDFIHIEHGWDIGDEGWLIIGHILKDLCQRRGFQMVWGGDWKAEGTTDLLGWDPAHWELATYRQAREDWPFGDDYDRKKHRLARFDYKFNVGG